MPRGNSAKVSPLALSLLFHFPSCSTDLINIECKLFTWMATDMKRKAAVRERYGPCLITSTKPLWKGIGFSAFSA